MNIWYSTSKHQVSGTYDPLTGNDNLDFLIILGITLLPVIFALYRFWKINNT